MRSKAFSCLALLSSCLASVLYSSIVRERAARLALTEPRMAGVMSASGEEREERSFRRDVDCLRALLKVVFYL